MAAETTRTFGALLRQYRIAAGLTQEQLAERAGLSVYGIQKLERGTTHPYRDTAARLASALDFASDEAARFRAAVEPVRRRGSPVREGAVPASALATERRHNLPAASTSFVGREQELIGIPMRLRTERLLTLTGGGGCGKTRLAIEVAGRLSTEFPDGVWFVDLSPTADSALLPATVLAAIEGHESPDRTPLESLLRHLRGRSLLLLLDNCEHVIDACADLLGTLLGASPELRVLATSREALRLPGELVVRVPPLTLPGLAARVDPDRVLQFEAVKLFFERARQAEPEFSITVSNSAGVADICRRLDGIPLAIELAAARAAAMSVQEIAARLDGRFDLLTSGYRTARARHRTLRATIDWSHDLLSPAEQMLLRRLAVFAGGWTLEGAENVCGADPLERSEILHLLMRLVDQSLVTVHSAEGRTRYRFLETVRAYAAERLQAAGETAEVQARHRQWCLDFAERAAVGLKGPDQPEWFRLLTADHDNVRAALDSCALEPTAAAIQLRLAAAMGQFWFPMQSGEARRRLSEALDRAGTTPSAARAAALNWLAHFELLYGDPSVGSNIARAALSDARALGDLRVAAEALLALAMATNEDETAARVALLEEGLPLARSAEDTGLVARYLGALAATAAETGDLQRARMLLQEGSALGSTAGPPMSLVTMTAQLGWLAVAEDRLDDAESHFQIVLDLGARLGSRHYTPAAVGLGLVSLRRGNTQHARAVYRRLLSDHRETSPDSALVARMLVYMASVDAADGLYERAQRLLGANEAWFAARGPASRRWWPNDPMRRGLVPVPPAPVDPLLIRARAEGRLMSLDGAVTYALESVKVSGR